MAIETLSLIWLIVCGLVTIFLIVLFGYVITLVIRALKKYLREDTEK